MVWLPAADSRAETPTKEQSTPPRLATRHKDTERHRRDAARAGESTGWSGETTDATPPGIRSETARCSATRSGRRRECPGGHTRHCPRGGRQCDGAGGCHCPWSRGCCDSNSCGFKPGLPGYRLRRRPKADLAAAKLVSDLAAADLPPAAAARLLRTTKETGLARTAEALFLPMHPAPTTARTPAFPAPNSARSPALPRPPPLCPALPHRRGARGRGGDRHPARPVQLHPRATREQHPPDRKSVV